MLGLLTLLYATPKVIWEPHITTEAKGQTHLTAKDLQDTFSDTLTFRYRLVLLHNI